MPTKLMVNGVLLLLNVFKVRIVKSNPLNAHLIKNAKMIVGEDSDHFIIFSIYSNLLINNIKSLIILIYFNIYLIFGLYLFKLFFYNYKFKNMKINFTIFLIVVLFLCVSSLRVDD